MARVSLKSDFVDGDKLFAQQLNNNFAAIEAALDLMNKINWQDSVTEGLVYFKGNTEAINNRDIIQGQLLYDIERQTFYIDYDGSRLEMVAGSIAESIVNTLEGDETGKAPSVHAVNEALNSLVTTLVASIISTTQYVGTDKAYSCDYVNSQINTLNANINSKYSTNRITSGTAAPSGGSNGDIYFKY